MSASHPSTAPVFSGASKTQLQLTTVPRIPWSSSEAASLGCTRWKMTAIPMSVESQCRSIQGMIAADRVAKEHAGLSQRAGRQHMECAQ